MSDHKLADIRRTQGVQVTIMLLAIALAHAPHVRPALKQPKMVAPYHYTAQVRPALKGKL